MDTLAIPSTSHQPSGVLLRSTRSAGSLRTPKSSNASDELASSSGHLSVQHDLTSPDLTFESATSNHLYGGSMDLHSSTGHAYNPAELHPSSYNYGSTSSRGSGHATIHIQASPDNVEKRKGDSWRSTSSGGALLANIHNHGKIPIAKTQNRIRLNSVFGTQLPGFPYLNSAAAAISTPALHPISSYGQIRPPSSQELRSQTSQSWSYRSRSFSAIGSENERKDGKRRTDVVSGGTDASDLNTSCSGGSNSSDDVDLDLSWDLEVAQNRQHAQLAAAAVGRANDHAVGHATATTPPRHVGIDIAATPGPSGGIDDAQEAMRRYRLAGKKRQSRSAVDLRQSPPRQSGMHRASRYSHADDFVAPLGNQYSVHPAFDYKDVGQGWSFAATPPLSPAELATFVENPRNHNRDSHSSGARSEGAISRLLRRRRPSFPLMSLLDHPWIAGQHSPGPSSRDSDTPRPSVQLPHDFVQPVAPFVHPASTDASPAQTELPQGFEGGSPAAPPTLSPDFSGYNSPRTNDEIPTPRTADFDRRHSRASMHGMAEVLTKDGEHSKLEVIGETEQPTFVTPQQLQSQDAAVVAATPQAPSKGHSRRSSSIFRFPFASIRNAFRPSSVVNEAIGEYGQKSSPDASASVAQGQIQGRSASPASSAEAHSDGSHSTNGISNTSTPPRLGATSRASTVITGAMLRPGPNTGLGISVMDGELARRRQSTLPVLSFSTPSEDAGSSSGHGHEHHAAQSAVVQAQDDVAIEVIQELALPQNSRRVSAGSAPPTITRFSVRRSNEHSAIMPLSAPANIVIDASNHRPLLQPTQISQRFELRNRVDHVQPARLLFFAAFVLGPWCFFVGGWCLRAIDGEYKSVKGIRCRCSSTSTSCACQANVYHQIRLSGGRSNVAINGQALVPQLDKYVRANRIGAVVTGTISLLCSIAALIAVARAW
ncbi:hypothetical protein EMMF5_000274 [Cystobasidiomycetes sp. EMM_F5]